MHDQARDKSTNAHELLEKGFQQCLELTSELQSELREDLETKAGPRAFFDSDVRAYLKNFSESLYKQMAKTLFDLILELQGEDCGNEPVNFYFWPGYHSYLIKKRIFIRDDPWNFGVGIYNSSEAGPYYRDCSQARWYQFLIRPQNKSVILPIDIHQKFLEESALQKPDSLSTSLIVTAQQLQQAVSDRDLLELPPALAGTEYWGELLVNKLKSREGSHKKDLEEDPFISGAKARIQSLWLHAAFCSEEPPWLRRFIEELKKREDTTAAAFALERGLQDEIATDWGDWKTRRPPFRSWVNLSLRAWLNPLAVSFNDDHSWMDEPDPLAQKTVGSAALLCSIPIGRQYLSFARAWISEVYNTVRNAEMAIVFHNKQLYVKEALMAGPYFAHEIQRVVDQSLATALRDTVDNRQEAVEARRHVLYSIKTLCNLAYSFANAILSKNKNAHEDNRQKFIEPLRKLRDEGTLPDHLISIAKEIYKSVKRKNGATVIFPKTKQMEAPPDEPQHGVCFLLTAELLRNYCQSQDIGYEAEFCPRLDKDNLIIELTGSTGAQRTPVSLTLTRIDRFLRTLDVGHTQTTWDSQAKQFKLAIIVQLESASLPSASELSN